MVQLIWDELFARTRGHSPERMYVSTPRNILIVGASGGVGRALLDEICQRYPDAASFAWSRTMPVSLPAGVRWASVDITDEASIMKAAATIPELDLVVVATGLLHRPGHDAMQAVSPEKSWRAIDAAAMAESYLINAIGPALVAKHILSKLPRDRRSVFAALSARVGSISDNRLGGWYSYRASKAALNQIIRTLAVELSVKSPKAICVGLHPGTVDTPLSQPFQAIVAADRLFTPAQTANHLVTVIEALQLSQSGRVLDWAGKVVPE